MLLILLKVVVFDLNW